MVVAPSRRRVESSSREGHCDVVFAQIKVNVIFTIRQIWTATPVRVASHSVMNDIAGSLTSTVKQAARSISLQ